MTMIILLVLMVGMMFFMQRQQSKQAKQRQDQLDALSKGDEIVTIGGLFGVIDEIDREKQTMTLDVDGVYLVFELSAIKRVLSPTEKQSVDTKEEDSDIEVELIEGDVVE